MLTEILSRMDWAATGAMIGGLSTAVVAILTLVLVRENRLLRRAGNSPVVVAHFEPHPEGNGAVKLAFSNVGTGPALDVTYSFEQQHFDNYHLIFQHEKERPPLTMIGQGDKFSFIFAVGFNLFRPKNPNISGPLPPFRVNVSWRAVGRKKTVSRSYRLDIASYSEVPGVSSKPYGVKISDELATINKHLAVLARSSGKPVSFVDITEIEDEVLRRVKTGPPSDGGT